jgi:DNA-binding SARP family transcriptional activator/TolB-like protein/Flp pilus assembly protein TadD
VNHLRLLTLGRLNLVGATGAPAESLAKRKRKLALMAVLRLSRTPLSRDALAEMFWGGQDEARAKHSLSDALSHLRQVLGPDAIRTRQTTIELNPQTALAIDAVELADADAQRRYDRVVELYAGPFLNDLQVGDSPAFEHWVTTERERLRQLFVIACEHECARLAEEKKWPECAVLAARWVEEDLLSVKAVQTLLEASYEPRTEAAYRQARRAYQQIVARVSREHDIEIDDRIARFMAVIDRDADTRGYQSAETPGLAPAAIEKPATRWWTRQRLAVSGVAAALLIAAIAAMWPRADSSPRPAIAVLQIENLRNDSATAWLENGLPQMLAANLARVAGVDVIAPERVREVLRRAGVEKKPLTHDQALGLARGVGATIALRGSITRGDSLYVLALSLFDARSGRQLGRPLSVQSSDLIALTDAAVARVIGNIDIGGTLPRFADIETSSLQAYQSFLRARQAGDEGRMGDARASLDDALARDSNFVSAIILRRTIALTDGDSINIQRYTRAFNRTADRASEFDRLAIATDAALYGGEHGRAEQLGHQLVERYPRDPRAYAILANVLVLHGRNEEAEGVLLRALALDSLGMAAGQGPCAPCVGYSGVTNLRIGRGDVTGAERVARRWTELQPDVPASWYNLAAVLSFAGRFDEAITAAQRAVALQPGPDYEYQVASILLMAGRNDEANAIIARLERMGATGHEVATDLRLTLARERGDHAAAARLLKSDQPGLAVVVANSLARLGRYDDARAIYERNGHVPDAPSESPVAGTNARGFSWSHALLAEALAEVADTLWLSAIADSIQAVSTRSYYGRDWRLHHHVKGILAARRARWAEAAEEFEAARWCKACWTSTNLRLADVYLKLNRPNDALQVLRDAYLGPLDAMGRYTPRTEIDRRMTAVFNTLGMNDSAAAFDRKDE